MCLRHDLEQLSVCDGAVPTRNSPGSILILWMGKARTHQECAITEQVAKKSCHIVLHHPVHLNSFPGHQALVETLTLKYSIT